MPKSILITKEMIDEAAFAIAKEKGIQSLSARSIADRLKCSTQPLYKTYSNMEELKENTMLKLSNFVMQKIITYKKTDSPFLNSGLGYIEFAKNEKYLFQMFCIESKVHNVLKPDIKNKAIKKLMDKEVIELSLSKESKDKIFTQTMIFAYGLAVLAFLDHLEIKEDETANLLKNAFESFIKQETEVIEI